MLEVTKTPSSTLSQKDTFLKKPQGRSNRPYHSPPPAAVERLTYMKKIIKKYYLFH